jgi:hypothetical protein
MMMMMMMMMMMWFTSKRTAFYQLYYTDGFTICKHQEAKKSGHLKTHFPLP